LPLNLELAPDSWVISVIIKKFHAFLNRNELHILFLSETIETSITTKGNTWSIVKSCVLSIIFITVCTQSLYFKGKFWIAKFVF
jgi:hypothetical protein